MDKKRPKPIRTYTRTELEIVRKLNPEMYKKILEREGIMRKARRRRYDATPEAKERRKIHKMTYRERVLKKAEREAIRRIKKREFMKEYARRPEVKAKRKAYYLKNRQRILKRQRMYTKRPEVKARVKKYQQKPEIKAKHREYTRKYRSK